MAGTKGSGRPGGNPDIAKYGFTTNRPEPLDKLLQVRIPASMKEGLDAFEDKNEFIRQAIALWLSLPADMHIQLDKLGDRRNEFIRQAIADALASEE
jgi:Arc/MetJ-type ribon-helix-helix transcriptional regulator